MPITGRQFLTAISDYFSRPELSTTDIVGLLLLPGFIFMLWLFIYRKPDDYSNKDSFEDISEKDMGLITNISSQKGLGNFDRDFLIQLALEFNIKPVKLLLDQSAFERVEKILTEKAKKSGVIPDSDSRIKNLNKLKAKLF